MGLGLLGASQGVDELRLPRRDGRDLLLHPLAGLPFATPGLSGRILVVDPAGGGLGEADADGLDADVGQRSAQPVDHRARQVRVRTEEVEGSIAGLGAEQVDGVRVQPGPLALEVGELRRGLEGGQERVAPARAAR